MVDHGTGHLRVAGSYRLNEFGQLFDDGNYVAGVILHGRCSLGSLLCVDANTRQHRQFATQREAGETAASASGRNPES